MQVNFRSKVPMNKVSTVVTISIIVHIQVNVFLRKSFIGLALQYPKTPNKEQNQSQQRNTGAIRVDFSIAFLLKVTL